MSVRAQTVDRYIDQQIFLCTICALEYLCANLQPNICAQSVDEYFGRPFVHKWLTDLSEQKEKEKFNYIGQHTESKRFTDVLVQKR